MWWEAESKQRASGWHAESREGELEAEEDCIISSSSKAASPKPPWMAPGDKCSRALACGDIFTQAQAGPKWKEPCRRKAPVGPHQRVLPSPWPLLSSHPRIPQLPPSGLPDLYQSAPHSLTAKTISDIDSQLSSSYLVRTEKVSF